MLVRACGWGRHHGWRNVAELKTTKASSREKADSLNSETTYFEHGVRDDPKTSDDNFRYTDTEQGNLTISARSRMLTLGGYYEVAVEFSEADLARLLELFFKGRSANDLGQFMARVFPERKRRPSKTRRIRKA